MKFVIKGADFSADNIGRVPVRPTWDTDALNILSKYSAEQSDDVKYAFNNFIVGAKTIGVFDKIKALYLPFLASDINEAIINVKGNTTLANQGKLAFANKGLTLANSSDTTLPRVEGLSLTQNNYFLSCYNNENITITSENNKPMGQIVFSSWGTMYGFGRQTDSSTALGYAYAQGTLFEGGSRTENIVIFGSESSKAYPMCVTLSANSDKVIICDKNNENVKMGVTPSTEISRVSLLGYAGAASWGCVNHYGLLAIGEGLELQTVKSWNILVNNLMEVVLA